MSPLSHRIKQLIGLYVRLHLSKGKMVTTVDGVCQGIEGEVVVLLTSQGEHREIPLEQVGAVTLLAQERQMESDYDSRG
jgi:hypothetical protein